MKEIKKKLNPYKRKIVIESEQWTYRITSATVEICNPLNTKKYKFFIDNNVDLSCSCEDSPCDCYWWYDGPYKKPVKPKHIRLIIESLILDKNDYYKKDEGVKENPIKIHPISPLKS